MTITVGQEFKSKKAVQAHMYAMAERDDRQFNMKPNNAEVVTFVCANPRCVKAVGGKTVPCTKISFWSFFKDVPLHSDIGAESAEALDKKEKSRTKQERRWHCLTADVTHATTCVGNTWSQELGRRVTPANAYPKNVLMFCVVPTVMADENVKPAVLKSIVSPYLLAKHAPNPKYLGDLKREAKKWIKGSKKWIKPVVTSRAVEAAQAIAPLSGLCDYVQQLRACDHTVELVTIDAGRMQHIMIDVVKAKHKRAEKEKKKRLGIRYVATPFNVGLVKESDEYKSITKGAQYLYAIAWSPPTATHMHGACRPLSQSDMAHIKGSFAGNIFYRHAQVIYLCPYPCVFVAVCVCLHLSI
eukprot:SAG31_NODE_6878_length_1862_cov_1.660238_2_plen_356_part_00